MHRCFILSQAENLVQVFQRVGDDTQKVSILVTLVMSVDGESCGMIVAFHLPFGFFCKAQKDGKMMKRHVCRIY